MDSTFKKVHDEIQRAMRLSRCRKCGCMRGTLENLKKSLPGLRVKDAKTLLEDVNSWYEQLEPQEYPCYGCKYCIPPEAMNLLIKKYPSLASTTLSTCEIKISDDSWPPVEGEYTVIDKNAPVAVSVLSSTRLEERLARAKPSGLCIVGKTETENRGIHKIVKNVTKKEVEKFRKQITVEDMIGCENSRTLIKKIKDLSGDYVSCTPECGCHTETGTVTQALKINFPKTLTGVKPGGRECVPRIEVQPHDDNIKLDRAGYFVIIPSRKKKTIVVEHYSYDNKLLRRIEGDNSRDIYLTIIENGWVRELTHAAYLGKELTRAELSIKRGFKFVQDGA